MFDLLIAACILTNYHPICTDEVTFPQHVAIMKSFRDVKECVRFAHEMLGAEGSDPNKMLIPSVNKNAVIIVECAEIT